MNSLIHIDPKLHQMMKDKLFKDFKIQYGDNWDTSSHSSLGLLIDRTAELIVMLEQISTNPDICDLSFNQIERVIERLERTPIDLLRHVANRKKVKK